MKHAVAVLMVVILGTAGSWLTPAKAQTKIPAKIVFEAKTGNVTFDHTAHVKRVKAKCAECHDAVFPKSRAPIEYKAAMHKTAEKEKKACAHCHVEGGLAFESKGNCKNCHVK